MIPIEPEDRQHAAVAIMVIVLGLLAIALTLICGCATSPTKPVARPAYPPFATYVAVFCAGAVFGGSAALAVQKACRCP